MNRAEAVLELDTELNDIMYSLEKAQILERILDGRCFENAEPDRTALIDFYDMHATLFHILGDYIIEAKRSMGRLLEPCEEDIA